MKEGYKKTEVGIIPKEWTIIRVGDLVTSLKSGLSRSLKDENVGIPCIRSNNIKNNRLVLDDLKYWFRVDDKGAKIEDYILKKGDIIINFINSISQIGKGCIFDKDDFETIYTTNLLRIQVNKEKITNKYFYYYTQTERYKKEIGLITKPAVNQASFTTVEYKAIKLPVPPLIEQQKIAEILSAVDSQMDSIDNLIKKSKELKKGLMQRLLIKGIGHKEFKKSEVGEIPVDWNVIELNGIASIIDSLHETPNYVDDGFSMIRVVDVNGRGIDTENAFKVTEETYLKFTRKYQPQNGDVIMSRVGSYGLVSYLKDDEKVCIGQNIVVISAISMNKKFMFYCLSSEYVKKEIDKVTVGSSQKTLSLANINKLHIAVPINKEQEKIANILSSVDSQIEENENEKVRLEELKKGLMQQLLTGKIRVK